MYKMLISSDRVKEITLRLLSMGINWYVEMTYNVGDRVYIEAIALPDCTEETDVLIACGFRKLS